MPLKSAECTVQGHSADFFILSDFLLYYSKYDKLYFPSKNKLFTLPKKTNCLFPEKYEKLYARTKKYDESFIPSGNIKSTVKACGAFYNKSVNYFERYAIACES